MTLSLVLQHTYQAIEVGLCKDGVLVARAQEEKTVASKNLIILLENFLRQQEVVLADVSFIGANQGPGPFTTLRVVIATVNGIAFASGIPLMGVDGLDACVHEHMRPDYPVTVALLNAYHKDVYFAVDNPGLGYKGCANIEVVLQGVSTLPDGAINFIGNAVEMYTQEIKAALGSRAFIAPTVPQGPSLQQIATMAYAQWWRGDPTVKQLTPLYLKQNMATGKATF